MVSSWEHSEAAQHRTAQPPSNLWQNPDDATFPFLSSIFCSSFTENNGKCEKYSVCPHIILGFLAADIKVEMEVGQLEFKRTLFLRFTAL